MENVKNLPDCEHSSAAGWRIAECCKRHRQRHGGSAAAVAGEEMSVKCGHLRAKNAENLHFPRKHCARCR